MSLAIPTIKLTKQKQDQLAKNTNKHGKNSALDAWDI